MIERFRQTGLVLPGVLSLLALGILVSLGNWQWQRLQWKEGLIAKLEETALAEPVPLSMLGASENSDVLRFRRVRVTGTFLHDREMHVWSPGSEGPGWAVFTALRVTESVPAFQGKGIGDADNVSDGVFLIVDRGWVSEAFKDPATRPDGQSEGAVQLVGRLRKFAEPGLFATAGNSLRNEWYDRDRASVVSHFGADSVRSGQADVVKALAPVYLEAEVAAPGAGAPQPMLSRLTLSNRHLAYAFTWWGLAATLVFVYLAFAYARLTSAAQRLATGEKA